MPFTKYTKITSHNPLRACPVAKVLSLVSNKTFGIVHSCKITFNFLWILFGTFHHLFLKIPRHYNTRHIAMVSRTGTLLFFCNQKVITTTATMHTFQPSTKTPPKYFAQKLCLTWKNHNPSPFLSKNATWKTAWMKTNSPIPATTKWTRVAFFFNPNQRSSMGSTPNKYPSALVSQNLPNSTWHSPSLTLGRCRFRMRTSSTLLHLLATR